MKTIAILAVAVCVVLTAPAHAAGNQREKMKTCNAEARTKELKGDARREFMSQCLSVSPEEKQARTAEREKAKGCGNEARSKGLKGEAKRSFMTQCLAA